MGVMPFLGQSHIHPFPRLRGKVARSERLLWKHLRRRQIDGFRFRRQRPFGPYICDVICLEAGLIVELDGSQHVEQAQYDARRDAFMRAHGFRIARFWNADVMTNIQPVLDTIFEALHRPEMDGRFD